MYNFGVFRDFEINDGWVEGRGGGGVGRGEASPSPRSATDIYALMNSTLSIILQAIKGK